MCIFETSSYDFYFVTHQIILAHILPWQNTEFTDISKINLLNSQKIKMIWIISVNKLNYTMALLKLK